MHLIIMKSVSFSIENSLHSMGDPVERLRLYLEQNQLWTSAQDQEWAAVCLA